jgi:hypothetical protein
MDIMTPSLEQQPSPAPWLVRRSRIDVPRLIRSAMELNPDATVDQVVAQLARWNVQVSGIIVAMWLAKWKEMSVEAGEIDREGNLVGNHDLSPQRREPQWTTAL